MKTLSFLICVVIIASAADAGVGFHVGRISFSGDVTDRCSGEIETSMLYGASYELGLFPMIDLEGGLEYVNSHLGLSPGCDLGNPGVSAYSLYGRASVPFISTIIAKLYVGGGISYWWFNASKIEISSRTGYDVIVGLCTTLPASPLNGYIELRYQSLSGDTKLTTKSAYVGLVFSL